ncbi:MAG: hypothetical protein OXI01_13855 [Albidovulum sp.]|nr:hypothetical protein [Albidovulum sp.]
MGRGKFHGTLEKRPGRFGLELHPEKTRLIELGRFAMADRKARGERRPESFGFLGSAHYCRETRIGEFGLGRKPMPKRVGRTLRRIKEALRRRMRRDRREVVEWLGRVVGGWLNYYAVPAAYPSLARFVQLLKGMWRKALLRRSQKGRVSYAGPGPSLKRTR